jgi:hypothetical protein
MNPFSLFAGLISGQVLLEMRPPVRLYPIAKAQARLTRRMQTVRQWGSGILLLMVCFSCTVGWQLRLGAIGTLISGVTFTIVFILIVAAVIGLPDILRTLRISGQIAAERERGTYDLLSLTNRGAYGLHWWIARSVSGVGFPQGSSLSSLSILILIVVVVLAVMASLVFLDFVFRSPIGAAQAAAYIVSTIVAIAVYFRQNTAAAALIGMLTPGYAHKPFEAQFWALTAFLLFQVVTLGLVILLGFVIVGLLVPFRIEQGLTFTNLIAHLLLIAFRLALFVGLREVLIYALWERLKQRLNA